jgi:hypothetical protein
MKISGHTSSLRVRFILAIGIALISWYDLYNPECKKEPVGGFKQKCQSIAFLLTKTVTDSLLYKDILKIDSIVSDANYPYAAQLLYDSLMGLGVTPSIPRPSRNDRSAIIYQ